jgi:hypothetical protein
MIESLINADLDNIGLINSPQQIAELKFSRAFLDFSYATAELQKVTPLLTHPTL